MDPPTHPGKNGSALLVTLLVMGLMTMMVLAFSTHVRLELRNISNHQDQHLARANARLGLELALAQLQITAGPDQRATATAAILGSSAHNTNRHVTGVWNTQTVSGSPEWLISGPPGANFNPANPIPVNQSILLVGPGTLGSGATAENLVRAPLVGIPGQNASYAYWVGDEGVKASIALTNPFDPPGGTTINGLHQTEIDRKRFTVPYRQRGELAFSTPPDFSDPDLQDEKRKTLSLEDFQHFGPGEDPRHNGGFHHYTHNARGLLTHPLNGGVKKDLSMNPSLLGPGFEAYMNFPSYMVDPNPGNFLIQSPSDLRRMHRITPPSNLTPSSGEIVHSVVPIITDFGLQISPRRTNESPNARLMFSFILEMWNPYTSGIPAEDLILEITGFEPFTMTLSDDTDNEIWQHEFDVHGSYGDNTVTLRLDREQRHTNINNRYSIVQADAFDTRVHAPGRLLYWIGPADEEPEFTTFGSRSANQSRLNRAGVPAATFPTGTGTHLYRVGYEMPETTLNITLRRAPENGGQILARYHGFAYDDVENNNVGSLGSWEQRFLTWRFRVIERGTTYGGDQSAWIRHSDPRTPRPSFGDDVISNSHTMHENALSYSPGDSELSSILSVNQNQEFFLFDRVLSSGPWSRDTRRDIPLFELPRQPLISIGQLQHLHIEGSPPYSIGNPWGGEALNQFFDDYLLSGIQPGISMPDFSANPTTLPHPRYALARSENLGLSEYTESDFEALGENAAVSLEVQGIFNINSVSPEAWKSVMGNSLFSNFAHATRDTNLHDTVHISGSDIQTNNTDYPPGFTRFTQSIQEIFQTDILSYNHENDRPLLNMKPGVTFLTPRTGMNDNSTDYDANNTALLEEFTRALAEAVQNRNQQAGRPYFSLNELITEPYESGEPLIESLLRGDVDAARFPRLAAGHMRRIFVPTSSTTLEAVTPEERTPSWLSQADILTTIAPFISTRSDTFILRAYGDSRTSEGVILSRVWAEAVVQRVITPFDPVSSLPEMAENADGFGRKFKILSFKWLNESDI
ncbi:MAG: hypothetical protein JJU05_14390 [Verrucomicrobia bacterium]|nr:hypothetical protein [Verrucomicrobiota bacterium]MCH8528832.1 hypothetical protein [Kiritimatiellia bacterium]